MGSHSTRTLLLVALLTGSVVAGGTAAVLTGSAPIGPPSTADPGAGDLTDLDTFDSRADFQAYVEQGRRIASGRVGLFGAPVARTQLAVAEPGGTQDTDTAEVRASEVLDVRIGTTNVQVDALDEPDLVKTDGTMLYYSPGRRYLVGPEPRRAGDTIPRGYDDTHVIDPSDPAAPTQIANISANGQLLYTEDRLLVIGSSELTAYDVSTPAEPTVAWSRPLSDRVVTARASEGTLYLVTRTPVEADACPIAPIGDGASVPCTAIFRPEAPIPVDATYSVFALDAADGDVADSVSFVGTHTNAVVYMSSNAVYVTYTNPSDRTSLMATYLLEEYDRTPPDVEDRIREILSYDISAASTQREIARAVDDWIRTLDPADREAVYAELSEDFAGYLADRQRDLETTAIVRVGVEDDTLAIDATGAVPGRPLDQFSMSESDGTLRITTTIPGAGEAESVADLYVLDAESLTRLGAEQGMGEGQRVYAARYVDDTAYLITFRQIDPLHVVDLSSPANPTEVGTLELPGFSNYLHPIDDDTILGVGEEEGQVKVVLFDVSDPTAPTVADSMRFEAGWSAVSQTHHAFMLDPRHEIAFLPAGGSGVILEYADDTLSREHVVHAGTTVERARYVGDYLYVFAGAEVIVIDETTWERETVLELGTG